VEALEVREGQVVKVDEVLARLDSEQLELELSVLKAQLEPAEARIAERRSDLAQKVLDLEALTELLGRQAANPKELADAETERSGAEARLKASEGDLLVLDARIAQLRVRIDDMTIRAPFAGTVIARRCERGTWLARGAPVIELLSTGELEAWLEVPQQLLAATRAGLEAVDVRIDATGETLRLTGGRAIPDIDPRARTFRLVVPIVESGSLAAGMSVTAQIPSERKKPQLTIPRDAILRNEVGTFVYMVVEGAEGAPAQAAPTPVEVLFQTSERAVIANGRLRAGARVVVEGNERLFPMAPIVPIPADGSEEEGR
jgi:RND family efflux transporter MFP subunit